MLAFKTKIPYYFIDWFIILNEEKISAKSGCKSSQKDESPNVMGQTLPPWCTRFCELGTNQSVKI